MDEVDKTKALMRFLTEKYFDWAREKGDRRTKDKDFAQYLGVPIASYNQWVNGYRLPNYENAIKLSLKLGPEIFDILGYDRVTAINDPDLQVVVEKWGKLNGDYKDYIRDLIDKYIQEKDHENRKQEDKNNR